jgi:DNA helicase-4
MSFGHLTGQVRLLKALLKNAGEEAHLCVVGDDWQGINRFAGADISVMTEFEKVFDQFDPAHAEHDLPLSCAVMRGLKRFRSGQSPADQKAVETTNSMRKRRCMPSPPKPSLWRRLGSSRICKACTTLRGTAAGPDVGDRISVMMLGRYNNDEPRGWRRWQRRFGEFLSIEYRTVHSSKGLEADYVMLLNVVEGMMGFPSQITDDPVLQIAMPEPDPYPLAEAPPLYVALTRARRQCASTLATRLRAS